MAGIQSVVYPELETVAILSFPYPVPAILTLRAAGEMGASGGSLSPARRALLEAAQVDTDSFVSLHQIHSRSVVVADRNSYGADADGMITSDRRLCLGVTVADCMPIFLYDRSSGAFGLLHSGWRGTGIAADAVRMMGRHFGTSPEELTVMLGPAIGSCCYQVDDNRAALFRGRWGDGAAVRRDGAWYLDLRRANLDLLDSLGVGQVVDAHVCTACNDAFSSFRREGPEAYSGMLAAVGNLRVPEGALKLSKS